jgi:PAS domain S-box-containing protein
MTRKRRSESPRGGQAPSAAGTGPREPPARARELRQAFLLQLGDALRAEADANAVGVTATRLIAGHLKVDRCWIARISLDLGTAWIGPEYHAAGLAPISGECSVASFPDCLRRMRQGQLAIRDLAAEEDLSGQDRRFIGSMGIAALAMTALHDARSPVLWTLAVGCTRPRAWRRVDLDLLGSMALRVRDACERASADAAMRISEDRLARELADTRALQQISTELLSEQDPSALYERMLDAALDVMRADCASLQQFDPRNDELVLLASRGFAPECRRAWKLPGGGADAGCTRALPRGGRLIVEDVDEFWSADSPQLAEFHRSRIRAFQSTALVSRSGRQVGMISTHWRAPRAPDPDDLLRLDVLARQAADLIERVQIEGRVRAAEQRQSFLLALSDAVRPLAGTDDIAAATCRLLVEHLGLSRAQFTLVTGEPGAEMGEVRGEFVRRGPPMLRRHPFKAYGDRVVDVLRAGQTLALDDIETDARLGEAERQAFRAASSPTVVAVPLLKAGRIEAVLAIHAEAPRNWTSDEIALLEDVAERTWTTIERARAERALRASEAKYRTLFQTMGQGYFEGELVYDGEDHAVDYVLLELNPAFEHLTGIPVGEARGRRVTDVFPAVEPWWIEEAAAVVRSRRPRHGEHYGAPTGRWFEVHLYPSEEHRFIGLYEDITERKEAEQERQRVAKRQAFLLRLSDAMRGERDAGAVARRGVRMLAGELGLDRCDVLTRRGQGPTWFVAADVHGEALQPLPPVLDQGHFATVAQIAQEGTLVLRDVAGDPVLGEAERSALLALGIGAVIGCSARAGAGNPVWMVNAVASRPRDWSAADIALMEEAAERLWTAMATAHGQAALEASEEKYRTLFFTMGQGYAECEVLFDGHGRATDYVFIDANPAFEELTGIPLAEALGHGVRELFPDIEDWWVETAGRVVRTGIAEHGEHEVRPLGAWRAVYFYPAGERRVIALFEDITDRKRIEQERQRSAERQGFLLRLGDALRADADPRAIGERAVHMLAGFLGLDRCFFASRDATRGGWVVGAHFRREHMPDLPAVLASADWRDAEALVAEHTLVCTDIATDQRLAASERGEHAALRSGAMVAPVLREGARNPVWALVAVTMAPRQWTNEEISLVEEAAERIWSALGHARAARALEAAEAESNAQRRYFESVLDSSLDLIYVFNLEHRFTYANKALLEMWGRSLADSLGKRLSEVGYEPWHVEMHEREIDQVVATRQPVRGEVAFTHATLGPRVYDYIFVPMLDDAGQVVAVAGSTRDITERKRAEDALRAADRAKDDFLAMLGHELRNPLAAASNAAQLIAAGAQGEGESAPVRVLDRQLEHMTRLVDDLLDVSRVTQGKIRVERVPVDLGQVTLSALDDLRHLFRARHLVLEEDIARGAVVLGDALRLEQVVTNLVGNALKFTSSGGIRVVLGTGDGFAELRVEDSGRGIPADVLPHVFDLFSQGEVSIDRGRGGLGIGLTVAKRLVELHDGEISAVSAGAGAGSTFIVTLPLASQSGGDGERTPQAPQVPAAGKALHVLVVDDNVDFATGLVEFLHLLGHRARCVHDGGSGIEAARAERPDLVLLDIGLPGVDGYEVARRLRAAPDLAAIRIVALTGYGQDSDRERALAAGFDQHMVKPLTRRMLEHLLVAAQAPAEPRCAAAGDAARL